MSRLPITSGKSTPDRLSVKQKNRLEAEGKFERLWKTNPQQFNPDRHIMDKTRIDRIVEAIHLPPGKGVDLGLGWGKVSDKLIEKGFEMEGVDISSIALDHYEGKARKINDFVPYTKLEDNSYRLVMALDLIAELPDTDRRLLMSEMSRLVTSDGKVVISTPIDIDAEDAIARFLNLIETEFIIEDIVASFHAFWIRLFRYKFLRPIIRNSEFILRQLENLARFLKQDDAISHLIVVGHRKPLYVPPVEVPTELKGKKMVWE